ncbi:MAG: hypothetical protein KA740_06650 [Rhodoferax sp.]|nr:hypothetical protein [Rhodoferax sp.]
MRRTLIQHMQRMSQTIARVNKLPPPHDRRGFYTATQMTQIIGRPPRWTDGTALHLLGWTRTVRKVNNVTRKVWLPPEPQTISQPHSLSKKVK